MANSNSFKQLLKFTLRARISAGVLIPYKLVHGIVSRVSVFGPSTLFSRTRYNKLLFADKHSYLRCICTSATYKHRPEQNVRHYSTSTRKVTPGESQKTSIITTERAMPRKEHAGEEDPFVQSLYKGLLAGERAALARSITLVESTNANKKIQAQKLLKLVLEEDRRKKKNRLRKVDTFRIGRHHDCGVQTFRIGEFSCKECKLTEAIMGMD